MKLYEFEAKQILKKSGVKTPRSGLLFKNFGDISLLDFSEPVDSLALRYPSFGGVIAKGQILSGARKKSGAVEKAENFKAAAAIAENMFAKEIVSAQNGEKFKIETVLVEEFIPHREEIYLSFSVDRDSGKILILAAEGGTEIEDLAKNAPEKIFSAVINPLLGLKKYAAQNLARKLGIKKPLEEKWFSLLQNLLKIFIARDASLLEINPLTVGEDSEFAALDAKMIIDDNALFRQEFVRELTGKRKFWQTEENPLEKKAEKIGVSYVKLDGDIGCIVNGAGLAMATMDLLKCYYGSPANFLDVGGGASKEKIAAAFEILLEDANVKIALINILGGILRCDVLAEAVCETLAKTNKEIPIIARLAGTNAEEAKKIFEQSGRIGKTVWLIDDLDEAARVAAKAAKFAFAARKAAEIFADWRKNGDSNK